MKEWMGGKETVLDGSVGEGNERALRDERRGRQR